MKILLLPPVTPSIIFRKKVPKKSSKGPGAVRHRLSSFFFFFFSFSVTRCGRSEETLAPLVKDPPGRDSPPFRGRPARPFRLVAFFDGRDGSESSFQVCSFPSSPSFSPICSAVSLERGRCESPGTCPFLLSSLFFPQDVNYRFPPDSRLSAALCSAPMQTS